MKKLFLFGLALALASCTLKEQENKNAKTYFDLESYFKKEALRLQKANPVVNKTVMVNGKSETHKVKIADWEKEFDLFIQADINKAAWRGAFSANTANGMSTYTSQSAKVPVKKLEVSFKGNKVSAIRILVSNTNDLYKSNDSLSYYPDSLYQIKKVQQIRLRAEKKYEITGKFN
ncbi:hypothetical protein VRU48_00160 [Pedobacter sp. KR3-3]|uniref:DUF4251 domain-containing protein n=1 Tax=Pedobacter albus TaxID=3113905 RepID=A0ABU7I223_9SPHI|nr:hypothetical protein [Pedobacter sp. KR3-3]MEE1943497.1 hypothetical protein [Pedobacter sp. KR3-3]